MAATRGGRGYERYGWVILLVSAILGLVAGLTLTFAPLSIMVEPAFAAGNVPGVLRAWGITWVSSTSSPWHPLQKPPQRGEVGVVGAVAVAAVVVVSLPLQSVHRPKPRDRRHHRPGAGPVLPWALFRFGGSTFAC